MDIISKNHLVYGVELIGVLISLGITKRNEYSFYN